MPFFVLVSGASGAPKARPNQIRYEYLPPKNPEHKALYDHMKQARALELLQELLRPIRLPDPLPLRVMDCGGATVCYALLAGFVKNAPDKDLPIGISRADTIIGPATPGCRSCGTPHARSGVLLPGRALYCLPRPPSGRRPLTPTYSFRPGARGLNWADWKSASGQPTRHAC